MRLLHNYDLQPENNMNSNNQSDSALHQAMSQLMQKNIELKQMTQVMLAEKNEEQRTYYRLNREHLTLQQGHALLDRRCWLAEEEVDTQKEKNALLQCELDQAKGSLAFHKKKARELQKELEQAKKEISERERTINSYKKSFGDILESHKKTTPDLWKSVGAKTEELKPESSSNWSPLTSSF